MLYELHVTVDPGPFEPIFWQQKCEATGSKPLMIELSGTPNANVQMMNAQTTECDPSEVMEWVGGREATANGFKIVRSKLEVPLDKGFVDYPDALYHECHVKLLVKPEDVDRMMNEAKWNGWVVSRNLFFTDLGGYEKWYLTRRIYASPALQAGPEFLIAWSELEPKIAGVATARMEMESVIADSNPGIDAGWIQ